ncbi:alpha-hydroxy-acid oxidizing protein [Kocuria sp. CPCC 205297]|uniref:alpha-hydroxy-acid oxidizing protein n=1 Tax=Kocuria sp. CPCC 205297 TaxID=3073558 RepID=UPI0034D77777
MDGAAGQELTHRRSREAFESVELLPRVLHGTEHADLSTGSRTTAAGNWDGPRCP